MKVIETDEKVEVLAEPYGSATFDKTTKTVSVDFYDSVPWDVFAKVFKHLKRAVNKSSRLGYDFDDTD